MNLRLRLAAASLVLASLASLAACGSDVSAGGGGSGGGHGDFWIAYCEGRGAACGKSADACKPQESCARAMLRDEAEAPLFACLSESCDEDQCLADVSAALAPTAQGQEFAAACQAHLDACPGGNDDICSAAGFLADDLLATLTDCTAMQGCDAVDDCYDAVTATFLDVCEDWI